MGYKNKSYYKDLQQQAYDKLSQMKAFGESKYEAMKNGTIDAKIFSFNTHKTYWKHIKDFTREVKKNHPECKNLKDARQYIKEYLDDKVNAGQSPYTIQVKAKALGKLYGIKPNDPDYYKAPQRHREDIKRSRGDAVRDKHFSKTNNDELIKFAQGTGLRRSELSKLKGEDLVTREQVNQRVDELTQKASESELTHKEQQELDMYKDAQGFEGVNFFLDVTGKGGRERISPIIGPHVDQIVERIQNTEPDAKVWSHVNTNADIHSYRADYATRIYKENARDIKNIPFDRTNKGSGKKFQSEVYHCRVDEKGKKLDKKAMKLASKALGHNRIEVVANNYIRGL